jgi:serine/threonine protein kinase
MKIGKYEVLETIRAGSMATLYKALDPEHQCEVALKSFQCPEPEMALRFQRELRSRASLTHANIEQIVTLGDQGSLVYVATEWLQGEDIGHFVARRAILSLEERLDFMLGICEGLAYAHENHVIHCDISPGKLFRLQSGAGKILDFGTSAFWSVQFCQSRPGRPPDVFPYRAPEQIDGRNYDPRTDVFSAGLVFFEFLTGTRPFAQMLGGGIRIGDSRSRQIHGAMLPDSLMELLQRAIAVDPAARFQSAAEMLTSIREVRDKVVLRRAKLAEQIQSDCKLIYPLLAKLKGVLDSSWVRKRLREAGVDSKLLEQIQSKGPAGFASGLQYLGIMSLSDELKKAGILLTQIHKEIDAQRQDILALRSVLPEVGVDLARELLDNSGDLFSADPEVKSAKEEIRIQLRIKDINQAIRDFNVPVAQGALRQFEMLYGSRPDCATVLAHLRRAVAELEKQPARKPPETKPPLEMPQDKKQSPAISQPGVRPEQQPGREAKAVAQEGARAGVEAPPVKEGKAGPANTRLTGRPDNEAKKEPKPSAEENPRVPADRQKAKPADSPPRARLELQPSKEGQTIAEDTRTEPDVLPMEDATSGNNGGPGESGVKDELDLQLVRTLVADLLEENPEKCLAFLDTLESPLIEDPIIESLQQKALEARKERGAEITLTKPKKRAILESQEAGMACPFCNTPNPIGSRNCSLCNAVLQGPTAAVSESYPGAKPIPTPTAAPAKQHLHSPAANTTIPRPRRAPGHSTAKYYATALLALIVIGVSGWFLYNKHSDSVSTTSPAPEIIGAAETAVEAALQDGTTIVANLPKGTHLDVLRQPGASNPLVQDPDVLLLVRTRQEMGGKPSPSGFIKARFLDRLEIGTDKAYTGWHALWAALDRFPDTERTSPSDLKLHLESVQRQIDAHPEVVPPAELTKKQTVAYLSLARRSKNPMDARAECKNAARYKEMLAPGDTQALAAAYESLCTPQIAAPPKPSCDEVLRGMEAKVSRAGDLISNDEFLKADRILQQILTTEPCNNEVRKLLQKAEERHKLCLKKLIRGKKN